MGATLPELHLLPRVQYLLIAEAEYELEVPDPARLELILTPHSALSPLQPDDPLRFEAYWPNEDSPLEDLILLRPDDERLSVKAEVAGGTGEVEVYWLLDGRLNHRGLASDDVELLPGKHDDARLTAVDGSGQPVVVKLPRVVKLLPLELPEMSYAVWTDISVSSRYPGDDAETAIRHIREGGFDIFHFDALHFDIGDQSEGEYYEHLTHVIDVAQVHFEKLFILLYEIPHWAAAGDVSRDYDEGVSVRHSPTTDALLLQQSARTAARRHPEIDYWMVSHESNISQFWLTVDPYRDVERIKTSALGIWYEQPSAAIVAPGLVTVPAFPGGQSVSCSLGGGGWGCAVYMGDYMQALYDHGFARWVDIVAYHPGVSFENAIKQTNQVHSFMEANGEGDAPLWATSVLIPSTEPGHDGFTPEQRASQMVQIFEWMAQDERVTSAHIWIYRDHRWPGMSAQLERLTWGLVQPEFVNGQPVPTPTWTAVVEFLRAQREKQAAGE